MKANLTCLPWAGDSRCSIINTTLLMKKKIIQDILMVIIVAFMCLIFGRTSASGSNNLAWLLIVVLANIAVIIYDFKDYASTVLKQFVITVPFIFTLIGQADKISSKTIPETCQVLWQNYTIGFVICAFNIVILFMNYEEEDKPDYYNLRSCAEGVAVISGLAMIVMACVLISKI